MGNKCVQSKHPGASTSSDNCSLCDVSNMSLKQFKGHQQSYTNNSSNDKDSRQPYHSPYRLKGERLNMNDGSVFGKQDLICGDILGQGGFGSVFATRLKDKTKILSTIGRNSQQNHGEYWFAVKEMKKNKINTTKKGIRMLIGELAALKRLTCHPFIIRCEFAFSTESACILGLDMCLGGDLRNYLYHKTNFTEREVGFLGACLLSAVDYIHSKGIIHRDIKPENIILDQRGYPHITDFGVAYVQDVSERNEGKELKCNLSSGTKQYLAPEVFTQNHVHCRAVDFWSIGIMLFELLYRMRPWLKACPKQYVKFLEEEMNCDYTPGAVKSKFTIQNQVSASSHLSNSMNSRSNKNMSIELDQTIVGNLQSDEIPASSEMSVISGSSRTNSICVQSQGFIPRTSSPATSSMLKPLVAGKSLSISSVDTDNISSNSPSANSISSDPPILPSSLRVRIPNSTYNHDGTNDTDITPEGRDFISRMLHVIPSCRLGMGGFNQIHDHKWMATCRISWNSLLSKQTRPPFTPPVHVIDRSPDKNGYTLTETRKVDNKFSLVPGFTEPPFVQFQNRRNATTNNNASPRNRSGNNTNGSKPPLREDSKKSSTVLHYFSENHFGADNEETKVYHPTDCVAIEARSPNTLLPNSPLTSVPNTLHKKFHYSSSSNSSSSSSSGSSASTGGSDGIVQDDWPIRELTRISDRGIEGANEIFKRFSHMSDDFSALYKLLRSNSRR